MTHNTSFKIRSLPYKIVQAARQSRCDLFDHELSVLSDGQPHQCRSCLRLSQPQEGVILMAYRPFTSHQPYAESGPVFIHERDCEPYQDIHVYPPEFPHSAVVLRAYNYRDQIVGAEVVGDKRVEEVIAEMFDSQATAYLHARNLSYGCYMFGIDRA